MNLKKVIRFFSSLFLWLGRKPKKGVPYSKDIIPVKGGRSSPFRERRSGNNRKPTNGRNRIQTIDMGDGRFKFIKHKK